MKYFKEITNLSDAKNLYRRLSKELHPDVGGSEVEFKKMQEDYNFLLKKLSSQQSSNNDNSELINELINIGKVLLEKQVPQELLKKQIAKTNSPIQKMLFSGVLGVLNELR